MLISGLRHPLKKDPEKARFSRYSQNSFWRGQISSMTTQKVLWSNIFVKNPRAGNPTDKKNYYVEEIKY